MNRIAQALEGATMGTPRSARGLTVFPLFGPAPDGPPGYLTLGEASEQGLVEVTELEAGATVPWVRVANLGHQPVLLVDGEHLVGARQNRVVNVTVLVPAGQGLHVPVSCVEQGRWAEVRREFVPADDALYGGARADKARQVTRSLRRTGSPDADQMALWRELDGMIACMQVDTDTAAMSALYRRAEPALDELDELAEPAPGQLGALFALGDAPVGLDWFDHPHTLAALLPKLVRSWGLSALAGPCRSATAADAARASAFLDRVVAARTESFPTVGIGEQVRLDGEGVHGGALVANGSVVHLCAFERVADVRSGGGADDASHDGDERRGFLRRRRAR